MQKTYCDVCKKEVKISGLGFNGTSGKISFALTASIPDGGDVCLPCVMSALNKEAYKVIKRPYKKVKKEEVANVTTN